MFNKFLETVLDVKGNIASRRFNKTFFEKNDKVELWNWFEETENMLNNGYRQYWDCGQLVFEIV